MKFYYSNSISYLGEQNDIDKSLGGFLSASPIPNGQLENIFSSLSFYSFKDKKPQTKLIILKNEFVETIKNIEIYLMNNSTIIDFKFAFVKPQINSKGEIIYEKINNIYSMPYYAEFVNITNIENKENLGELKAGETIGIWVNRYFKDLNAKFEKNNLEFDLKLTWD